MENCFSCFPARSTILKCESERHQKWCQWVKSFSMEFELSGAGEERGNFIKKLGLNGAKWQELIKFSVSKKF